MAVHVDRQQGCGALRDERLNEVGVHVVIVGLDVAEHGGGAAVADGGGGGDIGVGDRDDLVSGADATGAQGEEEAGGAGMHADGPGLFHFRGEGFLEVAAGAVTAVVGSEEHGLEGGEDLLAQLLVREEGAGALDGEFTLLGVEERFLRLFTHALPS